MRLELGVPNAKQEIALLDTHRHVGYGGARGGGKSWFVRVKSVMLALLCPGIMIMIVRRTYPELEANHITPLKSMLRGVAKYNDKHKIFAFCNGSAIKFGYYATDGDWMRYHGTEVDVLFVDEATNLKEQWIRNLNTCVRGANTHPKRTYYTCNPGGQSHGYFKRLFIDRRFDEHEVPEDYSFIQALVTDNTALMEMQPEYRRELESLPPKLREAWLYGSWDIFEGQFFEDFIPNPLIKKAVELGVEPEELRRQHRWCHVIAPFDLNTPDKMGWPIMRSYDFGYNKPFSVGYWTISPDGVLYRIAELYGCTETPNEGVKWSPDEQFKAMVELERTHPLLAGRKITNGVADPAIWDASRGVSIAETAAKYGIYFSPGDNKRIPGWMQVHYRLRFDEDGRAMMYVVDTCKAFIRTMPLMMFSATKPEDIDTTLEDHCPDEVRYMCMSRPIKPVIPAEPKPYVVNPLESNRRRY